MTNELDRIKNLAGVPLNESRIYAKVIYKSAAAADRSRKEFERSGYPINWRETSNNEVSVELDDPADVMSPSFDNAAFCCDEPLDIQTDADTFESIVNEISKPDYIDIDGDGDKDEPMKQAVKDKEEADEISETPGKFDGNRAPKTLTYFKGASRDKARTHRSAPKNLTHKPMAPKTTTTTVKQMREWANSINGNVEDRGTYFEHPKGETVDLSLRDYLGAEPQSVKIAENEDIDADELLKEYKEFKGK